MRTDILILTTTKDFLEKFELGNVRILKERGYIVHYATNVKEPYFVFDENKIRSMGVNIHHIDIARSPYMLNYNRRAFFQLIEIIKKYDIKAIHCHTPVGGVLGRLAGRYLKKRNLCIIYTAHGFHFYKGAPLLNNTLYYAVERWLARYTDILITINHEDYKNAQKFRLKSGGKLYMIPGVGLDMGKFYPLTQKEREKKRKQMGLTEEDFFIVSVGELNTNKNQRIVLQALAKMKARRNDMSHIKYGICGDGVLRNKIREQIRKSGLQDIVILYGFSKNVPDILGCADVSIFPSVREGLGMAAIEALAMEVPVLAADNRGTREYMVHSKNGFVCRPEDVDGFVSGMEAIRIMTEEERMRMKAYCRESVRKFEKSRTESIMERVYEEAGWRIGCEKNVSAG